MAEQKDLEKYFDILIRDNGRYNSEHYLADDEARFRLYDGVRTKFGFLTVCLVKVKSNILNICKKIIPDVEKRTSDFNCLTSIGNEDIDYYVREKAIEKIVDIDGHELSCSMVDELQNILCGEGRGDELLVNDLIEYIDNKINNKKNDEIRQYINDIRGLCDNIEADLALAEQGVVAKDKKMLEILRSLKIGKDNILIKSAVEKTMASSLHAARTPLKNRVKRGSGVEKGE